MVTITVSELQEHFDRYRDLARSQPVSVTENGQEDLVILSADEYRRLKARDGDRLVIDSRDLSDDELKALEAAEIPEESAQFDKEYKRRGSA